MSVRAEQLPLQQESSGSILKPLLGWAAVIAVAALIRRYTREPSLPRMSEQWLLSRQAEFNRDQRDQYGG
jgi:hypothetical protein